MMTRTRQSKWIAAIVLATISAAWSPPVLARAAERRSRETITSRYLVDQLPISERMAAHLERKFGPRPLARTVLLDVQHGTQDAPAYNKLYHRLGVAADRHFIVNIPYSAWRWTAKAVKDRGYAQTVRQPGMRGMQGTVVVEMVNAIRKAIDLDAKLVITEDGGWAAPHLKRAIAIVGRDPAYAARIGSLKLGDVTEQTTAGRRRDDEARRAGTLLTRVWDVASTQLKQDAEGPAVGQTVLRATEDWMLPQSSLLGRSVAVFGLGRVGMPTISGLFGRGVSHVVAVAKSEDTLAKATRIGELWGKMQELVNPNVPVSLAAYTPEKLPVETIRKTEVFIDMSGFRTIDRRVIDNAPNHAKLVNGSSKQNPIDIEYLEKTATRKERAYFGTRYVMPDGRQLDVIANGEVANFWHRRTSISVDRVDPVMAMLIWGTVHAAQQPAREPGVKQVPGPVQAMIRRWMIEEQEGARLVRGVP